MKYAEKARQAIIKLITEFSINETEDNGEYALLNKLKKDVCEYILKSENITYSVNRRLEEIEEKRKQLNLEIKQVKKDIDFLRSLV